MGIMRPPSKKCAHDGARPYFFRMVGDSEFILGVDLPGGELTRHLLAKSYGLLKSSL